MHKWETDVAVLLIFFCRDEQFKQVFEQVKKARPKKLLLYQDGAREGRQSDVDGIKKCRDIAEDIDWDCEVHTFYQEKNVGCDPSVYIAVKWAFSIVDKCIIFEDDVVPSQSLFRFYKELLDRYEDDTRVNMICGMNNNDVTEDIDESYLFTSKGCIWGWASWRRVIDMWDGTYSVLSDDNAIKRLEEYFDSRLEYKKFIKMCTRHKESGRAHHETINMLTTFLNNMINIVPKYNMISNVGVGQEATHGGSDIRMYPKKIRNLLYKTTYEIEFPLKHPRYVIRNKDFEHKMTFSPAQRWFCRLEGVFLKIRYGGIYEIKRMLKKLFRIR